MNNDTKKALSTFTLLVEKIANSKKNSIHITSEGEDFYRGEIHMIKTIGDNKGISSSEIARHFGITRAVVHKTLLKLDEKGCVVKQPDPDNASKHKLFLTTKGEAAYRAHENYHNQHDMKMYDFLKDLDEEEIKVIQEFLDYARNMVDDQF